MLSTYTVLGLDIIVNYVLIHQLCYIYSYGVWYPYQLHGANSI